MPYFRACYNVRMFGMRNRSAWLFACLLLLSLAPVFVYAQTIPTIVPCDGTSVGGGEECTLCHIAKLAQNVLNAGIYLAVFLSAFLFAYAGWQYITAGGDPGKASEAKKVFWNVGVGLVLILAAWLIVDLIMKVLISESVLLGPWNDIC